MERLTQHVPVVMAYAIEDTLSAARGSPPYLATLPLLLLLLLLCCCAAAAHDTIEINNDIQRRGFAEPHE